MFFAVFAGVRTKSFDLNKLSDFLFQKLLPNVGVYVAVKYVGVGLGFEPLGLAAFAAIEADLTKDLTDSLAKLGLKWPLSVQNLLTKPEPAVLAVSTIEYLKPPTTPENQISVEGQG